MLDPATLNDLLAGKGSFPVRYPNQGRHVEGNLGKQLAALIVGSKVYWIFPISSGKPSTPTILGSFQIYSRVARLPARRHVLLGLLHPRVRAARL